MSVEKIENLEKQLLELQKLFYKVEASLENIEKNIASAISVKEEVITHTEKHKVTEKRLKDIEIENKELREKVS
jgi:ribosomal protein L21